MTHDILDEITCVDMDSIEEFIGKRNVDLYQKLFGNVQEA